MNAEIIAIGSEMLTPFRQDTNSLYLTAQLNQLGVAVAFKTIVGDNIRHLTSAVRSALEPRRHRHHLRRPRPHRRRPHPRSRRRSPRRQLRRDPDLIAHLYARVAARRMTITRNNEKQADVIDGATILPNPLGSAPGQWLDTVYRTHRKLVMLLPGPPHELKAHLRSGMPAAPQGNRSQAPHRHPRPQSRHDRRVHCRLAHRAHLHPVQRCRDHHPRPPRRHRAATSAAPSPLSNIAQARVDELAGKHRRRARRLRLLLAGRNPRADRSLLP